MSRSVFCCCAAFFTSWLVSLVSCFRPRSGVFGLWTMANFTTQFVVFASWFSISFAVFGFMLMFIRVCPSPVSWLYSLVRVFVGVFGSLARFLISSMVRFVKSFMVVIVLLFYFYALLIFCVFYIFWEVIVFYVGKCRGVSSVNVCVVSVGVLVFAWVRLL